MRPFPQTMPGGTRGTVERMVEALVRIPNVAAVALGGSWARGTERPGSDVDLGLYYLEESPLDPDAVREVARRFDTGNAPVVTGLYEWGPWVNGGAWVRTETGKVDLLYRNVDQIRRVIEDATRGHAVWDYAQTPVYGFHSATYLGETEIAVSLHDPDGILAELKRRVCPYPQPLKRALLQSSLWGAEFTLSFARRFASQGDVYNTVGCLTRALGRLTQALYARNERYFLNDKGALEEIESFPVRPNRYAERVRRILARPGESEPGLRESVGLLETLFHEVVTLAEGAYRPRYTLSDDRDTSGEPA